MKKKRNTTMDAGKVEILESRTDLIPAGMRIVGFKDEDEFTRESYVKCTPEFLASLTMDRFQLHLSVYREAIRLTNEKMSICQQIVSNWLGKGSALLQNVLPCLKQLLLKAKSVLNIDETWCRVRIVHNEPRSIANFLDGFIGGIQTDAYAGYRFFAKQNPENEHILCWCHVRAKFKLAFDISKDNDAGWFVEQIGRLYAVELENRLLNRTGEQIRERRNRVDVTEILNKMLGKANRMLKDKRIHFGEMMNTALNYMITNGLPHACFSSIDGGEQGL